MCVYPYMYVNFFCFVLFSFIRGKGGRQLCPSLSGTVGGVTSPYTNTPFLEKNYMGKKNEKNLYKHTPYASPFLEKNSTLGKKCKKTIHTLAVRLAIPGKQKVHWEQKGKKTLHTHAVRLAIPGKKNLMGKKRKKDCTHTHPVRLAIPGKKKYIGKKNVKRLYTHINRIYKCINVPRVVYVHI